MFAVSCVCVCGSISADMKHLSDAGRKDGTVLTLAVVALEFLEDMMMNGPSCYSDPR